MLRTYILYAYSMHTVKNLTVGRAGNEGSYWLTSFMSAETGPPGLAMTGPFSAEVYGFDFYVVSIPDWIAEVQ